MICLNLKQICSKHEHTASLGTVGTTAHFFTCGKEQIFAIGRLNVPFSVLTVTTRILPSAPGWTSVMTAVGQ
jgi:hypothetical protein